MQAVLLAAGKSTRTYPLTHHFPKGLLPVCNKPILEHTMEALLGNVEEIILVVGFEQEQIRSYFGTSFRGIPLRYVEQKEAKGTGDALLQAKPYLGEWFLLLNGDDLYGRKDIMQCIGKEHAILVKEVKNPRIFGVVEEENGYMTGLVEKPEHPKSHLANIGCYQFSQKIFSHTLEKSIRGEYEVTDYVNYLLTEKERVRVHKLQEYWLPVAYPWDLLRAQEHCLEQMAIAKTAHLHPSVKLEGHVHLGEGVRIEEGVVLKNTTVGENTSIGKGSHIEGTLLSRGVQIGEGAKIAFSVLGEGVQVGNHVRMIAETGETIACTVKGVVVDSYRLQLGAMIGAAGEVATKEILEPGTMKEGGVLPQLELLPKEEITHE